MTRPSVIRIFGLLPHLVGKTARQVARERRMSEKTILRDIETLRELGVPLFYQEAERRWYLGRAAQEPAWFTVLQGAFNDPATPA